MLPYVNDDHDDQLQWYCYEEGQTCDFEVCELQDLYEAHTDADWHYVV